MSDDFPDRRDGSRATTSFEEWLDQHADSEGISRQELFERLVSSYWTLNEMVQLLDDSGSDTSLADIHPGSGDGGDVGAAPTMGGGSDADEDARRPRGRDRPERTEPERNDRGSRRRDRDRDRIADLRDRLDSLEGRLDDERERGRSQDKALEAVADRLSGIEADLEELASESESARESLSAEYESLADRIDDLEADIDGRHRQFANEQERLRSRLDAEFDDLETILEYLVDRTDDLDAGLEGVEQRHDDELSRLRWERQSLQSVLSDAAEHDARAGECEACGERVDFGLLAEPYCPACDALLTGVEERDKWVFLSDIVVTAEEDAAHGGDRTGPAAGPGVADPPRDGDGGSGSRRRTGDGDSDRPGGGRPDAVGADPTQPADPAPESSRGESESTDAGGPGPIDFGRSDADTGGSAGADEPVDSQFSFGDSGSDAAADDGSGSDPETSVDAPFGDLEDLEREERRNDKE